MRKLKGILLALIFIWLLFFILVNLLGYTEPNGLGFVQSNVIRSRVYQNGTVGEPLMRGGIKITCGISNGWKRISHPSTAATVALIDAVSRSTNTAI